MELFSALRERRSVRKFESTPVPDDVVWELLEFGNAAPSAGNVQAREFIVVHDPQIKKRLSEAALGQAFVKAAPVVVVVCGNTGRAAEQYGTRGQALYSIQDADAAVMQILLAAHGKGLGTCWVGAFDDNRVSSILKLPVHIKPIAIIPLGYPAVKPAKTSRLPIEDLVHQDNW